MELFLDTDRGGFFQTGSDDDPLVVRPKELYDNAVPSGNSAAADVLQRMALLTGRDELERAGVSAIRLVREALGRAPTGFGQALSALDLYLGPAYEIAIVGDPDESGTQTLLAEIVRKRFLPNVVVAVAPPGEAPEGLALLEDRAQRDGKPTAYVCQRFTCKLPVTEPDDLRQQLVAAVR